MKSTKLILNPYPLSPQPETPSWEEGGCSLARADVLHPHGGNLRVYSHTLILGTQNSNPETRNPHPEPLSPES